MDVPLTVLEAAARRRSIKTFKSDPIPSDLLDKVLEAARQAPSSFNLQLTRVVVIRSAEQKEALAQVAWGQKQIVQAPVTLVFASAFRAWEETMDEMLEQARSSGAWPEKMVEFVRANAPGFQAALGDREREYGVKDAMIAATHAALAAESLGLGTCFMNGWEEAGVKRVIGVGEDPDVAIAVVLPVGYPESVPPSPGRLPREKVIFEERWVP
ncbi:MAG: nitroreductase family protein [Verrucomicrobiia bacterium]